MIASLPRRLRFALVIAPVCAAGLVAFSAAAIEFARASHGPATLFGVGALLVAMMLADRFPVPVEGLDVNGVSLAFVFGVAAVVLFGWAAAVVAVVTAPAISQVLEHRPLERVAYNSAFHGLAALASAVAISPIDGGGVAAIMAQVGICALVQHAVNMILVTGIVSVSTGRTFRSLAVRNVAATAIPFALMASAALMLVVLWQRSPFLSAALAGPLITIALYQRSMHRELRAIRLSLTDPLTGLGNHRHFYERLQHALTEADAHSTPVTLCLLDVDDFKQINDRFGHQTGDLVLARVAGRLRQGGEAFRLGGDEFALMLPLDHAAARTVAESVVQRAAALDLDLGPVTVSAGIATYPAPGLSRDALIRVADRALYWAKEHGKNRVGLTGSEAAELDLKLLATGGDRAARYRAAVGLAKAVDVRDAYTGSHSERVGELSARIATGMGVDPEEVELTRLAGSLHDLGKLAIPEELLRKRGPLTDQERIVLERHPQIGYRMLETLGVEPVADWVLHHHERWDGGGYPNGIDGERIPLGARILFVADAYDAMTSDRVYRARVTPAEAVEELRRCAGTQFDPEIVNAFAEELGVEQPQAVAASA